LSKEIFLAGEMSKRGCIAKPENLFVPLALFRGKEILRHAVPFSAISVASCKKRISIVGFLPRMDANVRELIAIR
jgi:hypothetical protein